jgi:general secretion pathway protein G
MPATAALVSSWKVHGFTLIELLVTLAILALLSTLTVPLAQLTLQRAKEAQLRRALGELRDAIDAYKRATEEGRIARNESESGYPKSLTILVNGVEDLRSPDRRKVYFLRRIPFDPMASDKGGTAEASWQKRSYVSDPHSPKEGEDVYDIVSRSKAVGLNGVPYAQW